MELDLNCRHEWESQQEKYGYETEEDEFYVIGDRVYVDGFRPASVAYFGEVEFGKGDWVGVVLDEPSGNHDGRLHGRQYFQCAPSHGLFVRPLRVSRIPDSAIGSSAASSRMSTPLPISYGLRSTSRSPAGSSAVGSYIYDEDYRQDRLSTLSKKLRLIKDTKNKSLLSEPSQDEYRSPTPTRYTGILKRGGQRSQSTEPLNSTRVSTVRMAADDTSSRYNPTSRDSPSPSVFNFRPRRARLNEFESLSPGQRKLSTSIDLSNEPPRVGDRVIFRSDRGEMIGTLRFMGETNFATGEWAGVELDFADGKNDGTVLGERYFYCAKNYGLFVPAIRVRKCEPQLDHSKRWAPPSSTHNWIQDHRSGSVASNYSDRISPYQSSDSFSSFFHKRGSPPYYVSSSTQIGGRSKLFADTPLPSTINKSWTNTKLSYIDDVIYDNYPYKERPKFDEADIELQLMKSLKKPLKYHAPMKPISTYIQPSQPKSVKYTFSSSKYDGNPIVRRTLEYS